MERKYCTFCGQKLAVRESDGFNSCTGKRNKEKYCRNKACVLGCRNTGGHYYKRTKRWPFGKYICKNCGADYMDWLL